MNAGLAGGLVGGLHGERRIETGALGANGPVVTGADRGDGGFGAGQMAMRNIDDGRPRGFLKIRKNTLTKH